jgi:hypothetical protein
VEHVPAESALHFLGVCPALGNLRSRVMGKPIVPASDIPEILPSTILRFASHLWYAHKAQVAARVQETSSPPPKIHPFIQALIMAILDFFKSSSDFLFQKAEIWNALVFKLKLWHSL